MHIDDQVPDFGLYDEPPRRGRKLLLYTLLGLGYVLFVLGGLFCGRLFLENWRLLATRENGAAVQVPVPGGLTLKIPEPPPVLPALPAATGRDRSTGPGIPLPDWTGRDRINVLLLGIDHRDDEPLEGSRSDVMMLVSVDPVSKSVVMVSIPRDLWVAIPGYGEQRINVAHALGGPELAMKTVSANLGIKIDHYARIDFHGFEQIVDTLGGVLVDVERPIKDDEYPTDDYGLMRIYIPPGPQWMNGKTALQYARSRHSEDDFGRARRQQRVLVAMRDRALQANMIFKAPELVPLAQKTVATDFNPLDLVKLAKLSTEIKHDRIVNLVIDADYARPFTTVDGAEVLLPNWPAIQSAIAQAFNRAATQAAATPTPDSAERTAPAAAPTPAPSQIKVEVLNGTSRAGLAAATAERLRQQGFQIAGIDSADRVDYRETRLFAQQGREAAAATVASALGLSPTQVQPLGTSASGADVRVILGQDFQPPTR